MAAHRLSAKMVRCRYPSRKPLPCFAPGQFPCEPRVESAGGSPVTPLSPPSFGSPAVYGCTSRRSVARVARRTIPAQSRVLRCATAHLAGTAARIREPGRGNWGGTFGLRGADGGAVHSISVPRAQHPDLSHPTG